MNKGYLVLENGAVFAGHLHEYRGQPIAGEAVFNTSMNGYQEIITDPSYAGQILTFTYPCIGNYGFGDHGFESDRPFLQAIVVKEMNEEDGHYEAKWTFGQFIKKYGIPCINGIDTRRLTRILRMEGSMGAVITDSIDDFDGLINEAQRGRGLVNHDLIAQVSIKTIQEYGIGDQRIVLWDFGSKRNIINCLVSRGCKVIAVPHHTSAEKIMNINPDGIVLSNGPGNPETYQYIVKEIAKLSSQFPMMGICLGHQLLAKSLGANTYKMKFGHRGGNHPVKDLRTGQCYITSQNHGYAVDVKSLNKNVTVSHINLNDHTIEGICHNKLPLMSVQFHPEAAPGPQDTENLFDVFLRLVNRQSNSYMRCI